MDDIVGYILSGVVSLRTAPYTAFGSYHQYIALMRRVARGAQYGARLAAQHNAIVRHVDSALYLICAGTEQQRTAYAVHQRQLAHSVDSRLDMCGVVTRYWGDSADGRYIRDLPVATHISGMAEIRQHKAVGIRVIDERIVLHGKQCALPRHQRQAAA